MILKKNKSQQQDSWKSYRKKLRESIINVFLYIILLLIFISFAFGLHVYRGTLLEFDKKNFQELEEYIRSVREKTSETNKNLSLARKYNKKWNDATIQQKDDNGINPDIINNLLKELTKKYNIKEYNFTMSVPKKVEGQNFKGTQLEIFSSTCQISFMISDDVQAVKFLKDLQDGLVGYVVVQEFGLKKNKEYENQYLVALSSGASSGLVNTSISIKWYVTKKIKR